MTWYRLVLQFCAWYRVLVTVFSSGYDLVAAQVVWTLLSGGGYFLPFWYILPVHRTKVNLPPTATATPPLFVGRTNRTRKADPTCTIVLHECTSYRSIRNKSIEQKSTFPQPPPPPPPPLFVGRTNRTRKADPTCTIVLHECTSYRSIWNKSIEQKKVNLPQPGHHNPPLLCRTDRPDKEIRSYLYYAFGTVRKCPPKDCESGRTTLFTEGHCCKKVLLKNYSIFVIT